MSAPTPEQIVKLPKWAQDHIVSLTRQRDDAVTAREEYLDEATPSAFCVEYDGTERRKRRYIQAQTIVAEYNGVRCRIDAHEHGQNNSCIALQWEDAKRHGYEVAAIPESFQRVRLVSKEAMR